MLHNLHFVGSEFNTHKITTVASADGEKVNTSASCLMISSNMFQSSCASGQPKLAKQRCALVHLVSTSTTSAGNSNSYFLLKKQDMQVSIAGGFICLASRSAVFTR